MTNQDGGEGMNELSEILSKLSPEDVNRHNEAIKEGYKDEQCPKCKQWFLAFHHFIRCDLARHGDCPMVSNPKSLLEQIFDEEAIHE